MKILDIVALALLVVGGLNWGLWGAFQFDLVAAIGGGNTSLVSRAVYILVGVAALYGAAAVMGVLKRWDARA